MPRLLDQNESTVKMTMLSKKLNVDGKTSAYPIYQIRLDQLRYNTQNDRVATWVSEYQEEHGEGSLDAMDTEKLNEIIEGYIVSSDPEKLNATKKSICEDEQQEPGVVLSNGIVIDGNRRFTCLRQLARENDRFNWFEAAILPDDIGQDRCAIKCLELSQQFGREERVGYDPVDRLVGVYRCLIDPETRIEGLGPERYARNAGMDISRLNSIMARASLMVEFLDFIGSPKHFSLARSLKVDGPLGDLEKALNRCGDHDAREILKRATFANMLVEPKSDMTRFVRDLGRAVNSEGNEEILEKELDLTEEVVDKINACPEMTTETIRNEIRSDLDLQERMRDAVDAGRRRARQGSLAQLPARALKDAGKVAAQAASPVLLANLDGARREEVLGLIRELRRILDDIESALD